MATVVGLTVAACGGASSSDDVGRSDIDVPPLEAGIGTDGEASPEGSMPPDGASPRCNGSSVFADPKVEAAVRESLGHPEGPLAADDLARVSHLDVSGAASLEGVQCLEALKGLYVRDGSLEDLSPLTGLPHLTYVTVDGNDVHSLAPLSDLPSLRRIRAANNAIASLADLSLPKGSCYHVFDVRNNPLTASDVAPHCALGWVVTWGDQDAGALEQCNLLCP